jgi:serine/threonine protein kinase
MSTSQHAALVLGRYRPLRRLAQGGMGVLHLGRLEGAAGFAKPVVIKRIIPGVDDPEASAAQFIREAQILSNLQHQGIVGVLDFGMEPDGYAMVLEYVHGYDLARWLKYLQMTDVQMHWEEAVFIMLRVLDALGYAHSFSRSDGSAAGVLHRDISPGNILLDLEGQVRLLDFGIARMAQADAGQYKTEGEVLKGKLGFLAPELFALSPASPASDLYACGVVLYRMLTGVHPFAAEDDSKLMWKVVSEPPRPLSDTRADLPLPLVEAVLTALEKAPEHRHASAEKFARALRQTLTASEADTSSALRERLRNDFNGDMPRLLKLEPLQERERAWRQASVEDDSEPLRSSRAPALTHQSQQPTADLIGQRLPEVRDPGPAEATHTSAGRASAPVSKRRWVALATAGGVAITALLALALKLGRGPEPAAPRFIVVESPEKRTPQADTVVATVAEPSTDGAPVLGAAPERGDTPRVTTPPVQPGARGGPADLSRQFARRQAELEVCFERHAAALEGQPQMTINFELAASGAVSSASLDPARLAETPLGQCLVSVATRTSFGPQPKAVRFGIPVRARAISK